MTVRPITEYEFDLYEPIDNHFQEGTQLFETYGKELDFVLSHDSKYIWTQVDGDDGVYIVNGYHLVNRIGYYITRRPHPENKHLELCVMRDEDFDE